MNFFELADKQKQELIELRRWFHSHPEVSFKEYETAKHIEEHLDMLGLPHRRVGETGVYAWLTGDKEGKGTVV